MTKFSLLDNNAQLPPNSSLKKRAKSKYYTQQIVYPMFALNSRLNKTYSRAFHCGNTIVQEGKKLTSSYCNARICHVCARIRTAKMMSNYINPVLELGQMYFTTLTLPNCKKEDLKDVVKKMHRDWNNILRKFNEKDKISFSGFRKTEITYNDKANTYHPHLHILHNTNLGTEIINEWLKRNPLAKLQGYDRHKCKMVDLQVSKQVIKKNKNDNSYLNEIFKYASKFLIKDKKQKSTFNIYPEALDNILLALHGKRTIQTFGNLKKIKADLNGEGVEELKELQSEIFEELEETKDNKIWQWVGYDWQDKDGNSLTNYKPPDIEFKIKYIRT